MVDIKMCCKERKETKIKYGVTFCVQKAEKQKVKMVMMVVVRMMVRRMVRRM